MNKKKPLKLFLLGGYDLEMLTIKEILEGRKDCEVADRNLQWDNAQLSVYQKDLQHYAGDDIYGLELREDMPTPENYHRIDHHNDWNGEMSALEQIAELLGIKLSRYQQLVAANDRGYIPAMKALSATEEEIADIRRRDREAQGVCEADELLAEQSVANHLSRYGSLLVVYSLTSHFSPICDRLFPYRRLLIYSDTKWVYYGEGKAELVAMFAEDIKQKRVYHGGGDNGYIGVVNKVYTTDEIILFVKQIKEKYGCI
jgi:hypothetical protein